MRSTGPWRDYRDRGIDPVRLGCVRQQIGDRELRPVDEPGDRVQRGDVRVVVIAHTHSFDNHRVDPPVQRGCIDRLLASHGQSQDPYAGPSRRRVSGGSRSMRVRHRVRAIHSSLIRPSLGPRPGHVALGQPPELRPRQVEERIHQLGVRADVLERRGFRHGRHLPWTSWRYDRGPDRAERPRMGGPTGPIDRLPP
jgi:hypothetical protein